MLIAAVAEATGLEHADAAFVIGPAAYAAAVIFAFLFGSRLLGTSAGLLAAAFLAHQLRWIFLHTWTEPVVIAFLLALLALLARSATPRRAATGGLLVGVALLVRNSALPLLALGGLACVLGGDNRLRQLLLFGGGASIALAGLLLGVGSPVENPGAVSEDTWVGAAHERARVGRGQAPDVPVLRRRG